MSFHHPQLLWLLALPVLWGFWQWVARGHPVAVPFDHGRQRAGRWLLRLVKSAALIPAALLAIAVLLLAGPRRNAPPKDERVLNNIIICLDVSGSMDAPFGSGGGDRFDAAVEAILAFCRHRQGDAFGLTIFGSEYIHWLPPTSDLSAIANATAHVRPDDMPAWMNGTLIVNALTGCHNSLVRIPEGDRAIILITDGGSADFRNGGDLAVTRLLAEANIRVFSILIGDDGGGPSLEMVASGTNGKVFTAMDPGTLNAVFREIDNMQKARFRQVAADWVDDYLPLSLGGLGLLLLGGLSMLGIRFTPW